MKAADMVLQSEFVAHWAKDGRLAFVGDGDSISVCVAYLASRKLIDYGPSKIKVFDFDERMVNAIRRFADQEGLSSLDAELYNCVDPLVEDEKYDFFYTNPPWGASNGGESVNIFLQRGIELLQGSGEGVVVIADEEDLPWAADVLANVQQRAASYGFYVSRLMPKLHSYHLDDDPDLRSCNLLLRSRPSNPRPARSAAITDPSRLVNFYGEGRPIAVRYVRERQRLDYGKAHPDEYDLELIEEEES